MNLGGHEKMKANKIIATLVVMTMLLSTLVVLKELNVVNEAVATTPGFNAWGNATTKNLYYMLGGDSGTSISFNTTGLQASTTYYLYKPRYNCTTASVAIQFEWDPDPVTRTSGPVVVFTTDADPTNKIVSLGSIKLDRAGMWVFDEDDDDRLGDDRTTFGDFFWVNASRAYTIDKISDFTFGAAGSRTISVKEGDSAVACFIDLINPEGDVVLHDWTETPGTMTFNVKGNITMAGTYTVRAYRDLDLHRIMYQYGDEGAGRGYDNLYGQGLLVSDYDYDVIGPWDPPEKNATDMKFKVNTAKPNMVLTNTTVYWGYATNIDINVTEPDGTGIDADEDNNLTLRAPNGMYYRNGDFPDNDFEFVYQGNGNYTLVLPQYEVGTNDDDWDTLVSGTWYILFGYDVNDDGTEEWNSSVGSMNRFTVKTTTPPVQLKIIDDGDGNADKKVDIPMFTDGAGIQPLEIIFEIIGTSVTDEGGRLFYGDDTGEDWKNITVTGDLLWPIEEDDLEWDSDGTWYLYAMPTKPGGKIMITIDWPGKDNGSASQTIDVVNGSFLTTNIESFPVGENITLTVTVKDMDNEPLKYANVYLVWEDLTSPIRESELSSFNDTSGTNAVGNGRNGQYTFWVDTVQQGDYAPRYLAVAVYDPSSVLSGYAMVDMEKRHNMKVEATPVTAYAGDSVLYDITVTLLEGGEPDEDSRGGLQIMIYNETGEEVDDPLIVSGIWPITQDATVTDREIILAGGTYYLYAFNDTHDSQGYNATITVTPYTVTSSPSVLAWLIDTETNITFQVTPPVDGTLKLLNMTSTNGTWVTDPPKETFVNIENGMGMLEEIDATDLGNVTYEFLPEGGDYRKAEGLLRITTATATPNPATVYLGEPTVVTITVTHPATGAPLDDVRVGLDYGMNLSDSVLAKLPGDLYTNSAGKVQFSITADASGDITIFIENETDPDNEFVIRATARRPMTIHLNPSVNEGKTFTVEAKSNGVLITDATVTFTFDGQTWPTNTGVATITSPTVTTSLAYPITASAEGYITATGAIIMVLNIPKLIVAVAGEVKAGQTFTLTVADDTGSAVIGATVTFEGKTYTTGAGGSVTITAPSAAGSYPITATFPGYDPVSTTVTIAEGGGIPGFELVTLIAALGVAFLLLRRRRK